MQTAPTLWLYFALVLGVVLLPGLDMAFVLASSLTGGRRGGLAAVGGIVAGGVVHVTMASAGLAVIFQVAPGAFNALLLAGSAYVAWIGLSLLRGGAALGAVAGGPARAPLATFRQGALTALLNPKAYVFTLAVFPQFIRPEAGPVWAQATAIGLVTAATQAGVYGAVAVLAGRAQAWLSGRPAAGAAAGRAVGALLLAAALLAGWEGWRTA